MAKRTTTATATATTRAAAMYSASAEGVETLMVSGGYSRPKGLWVFLWYGITVPVAFIPAPPNV